MTYCIHDERRKLLSVLFCEHVAMTLNNSQEEMLFYNVSVDSFI